jgi:NAD(P)-dependent dehydrogenase (short-subunit alcohol dehydrogenase family)
MNEPGVAGYAEPIVGRPLEGRIAFVTGSSRGLGRTIAEALMRRGADVVLHDISEDAPAQFGEFESVSALATALTRNAQRAVAVTGDISDKTSVDRMVAEAREKLGPVSVLVNCAGGDIGAYGTKPDPNTPTKFDLADIHAVLNRNLIGTMLMCQALAPDMAERQQGSIINIGSVSGHSGIGTEVGYACAKAAVLHYTRCLAFEMRPNGVRVNAVSPGPAKTARFMATRPLDPAMMEEGPSLDRYAAPGEIAEAVAFLAGDEARFVSGQVLRVDGGAGLYPG